MNAITINTDQKFGTTVVPNLFIDKYMSAANGSYVKVYLYLLRCFSSPGKPFTLTTAADALDETEKDIVRALSYWEKNHVLSLSMEADTLTQITLLELEKEPICNPPAQPVPTVNLNNTANNATTATGYGTINNTANSTTAATGYGTINNTANSATAATEHDAADNIINNTTTATIISLEEYRKENRPETPNDDIYTCPVYTEEQIQNIQEKNDLNLVLNAVELYMERLLERPDIDFVAWLFDSLHFSADLILHLYEYCIGKNKKKREYIGKVAISWHQEGIDSVAKAQEYSILYDSCFNAVNKVFSLGRMPVGPERDYIKKWSSFKLNPELIEEACNRTILNISKPDFKYTDRILENWYNCGVTSLAEVKALDDAHALIHPRTTNDPILRKPAAMTKSAANYNNYPQREYSSQDYSDLEDMLLRQVQM